MEKYEFVPGGVVVHWQDASGEAFQEFVPATGPCIFHAQRRARHWFGIDLDMHLVFKLVRTGEAKLVKQDWHGSNWYEVRYPVEGREPITIRVLLGAGDKTVITVAPPEPQLKTIKRLLSTRRARRVNESKIFRRANREEEFSSR